MRKHEVLETVKALEELPCEPRCRCLITCNPDHCDCAKKTVKDALEGLIDD